MANKNNKLISVFLWSFLKRLGFDNIMTIFFISKNFFSLSREVSIFKGFGSIILLSLLLSIPEDFAVFSFEDLLLNCLKISILFILVLLLNFILIRILGKKQDLFVFISSISYALLLSILFVSLPAFIFTHYLVNIFFEIEILSLLLFSIIPYYNFLFFGWATDTLSEFKGFKSWIVGLFSITLFFLMYYLLIYITV